MVIYQFATCKRLPEAIWIIRMDGAGQKFPSNLGELGEPPPGSDRCFEWAKTIHHNDRLNPPIMDHTT